MRKTLKIGAVLLAIILVLNTYVQSTCMAATYYTLNGGVGNYGQNTRYYYIDSSCNSGNIPAYIAEAWNDWVYTSAVPGVTTSISVRATTTQASSSFDFQYVESSTHHTLDAWTEHYRYNDFISINAWTGAPSANWGWSKINLNAKRFEKLPGYDSNTNLNVQKYILAHEIGHAMGLWHISYAEATEPTIMLDLSDSNLTTIDRCQVFDLNNINVLYN